MIHGKVLIEDLDSTCLGSWKPIKIIGEGLGGTVLEVCNLSSCDYIAKIPTGYFASKEEVYFLEDVKELNVTPKLIEVIECDYQHQDIPVIIMEKYDGDISSLLSLTYELKNIFAQAFNIIWLLLQNNIIHNDTRVENFVYKYDENKDDYTVKIIDFGIAKELSRTKLSINEAMKKQLERFVNSIIYFPSYNKNIDNKRKEVLIELIDEIITKNPEWLNK